MSFSRWLKDFFLSGDGNVSVSFPHGRSDSAAENCSDRVTETCNGGDEDEITVPVNPSNCLSSLNMSNQNGCPSDGGAEEIKPAIDLTDASRAENYVVYEASPLYIGHELGIEPEDFMTDSDPCGSGFPDFPDPAGGLSDFSGTGLSGLGSDPFSDPF